MKNTQQKLENWALQEMSQLLGHSILQIDSHTILAYGRYRITRHKNHYQVDTGSNIAKFANSKHAMSWCILDMHNRADWCIHFQQLDATFSRLRNDITAREQILHNSRNTRFCDPLIDKLAGKKSSLATVASQLEKYINRAKYLQHQGFANETPRTRHT